MIGSFGSLTKYGREMERLRDQQRRRAEMRARQVDTVHRFQPNVYWQTPTPATATVALGEGRARISAGRGPAGCGVRGMVLVALNDAQITCRACLGQEES